MQLVQNKNVHAAIFFICSLLFFIFVFFPSTKKINTDFPNYYVSSRMYLDGTDLKLAYDNVEFNKQLLIYGIENQIVSFIPYPPVNSLILIPLSGLQPLAAKLAWNIFNLIFFLTSVFFTSRIAGLNFYFTGIIFFLSGYALANNFLFGQVYLLTLALLLSSLYLLQRGNTALSALLLAISVCLKFFTVFFLLFFLFSKRIKMFLLSAAFILLLNVCIAYVTGFGLNEFYYTQIFPRISDGWVGTVYAPEFQSLLSLLHILFYREPSLNPNPLIESPELYYIIKYSFLITIVFVSSYCTLVCSKEDRILLIALFCFASMLLLPVNASYQYVINIPAIAIVAKRFLEKEEMLNLAAVMIPFAVINSPFAVNLIQNTKGTSLFFLGYVKFSFMLFMWIFIFLLIMRRRVRLDFNFFKFNFILAPLLLVLLMTGLSLSSNDGTRDNAQAIVNSSGYMLSMPAVLDERLIYTECRNERFILNSNFGFVYDNENVFNPLFINEDEIVFETYNGGKKYVKKVNIKNSEASIVSDSSNLIPKISSGVTCFSENGQIVCGTNNDKSSQITFGNYRNNYPVYSEQSGNVIFCSDRNRGVGFTALYKIKLKQ